MLNNLTRYAVILVFCFYRSPDIFEEQKKKYLIRLFQYIFKIKMESIKYW